MIKDPKTTEEFHLQGKQFLEETGTTMEVGEPEFGLHFHDDNKPRYRFPVTFKRGNKRFTLTFGQSYAEGDKAPTAYDVLAALTKSDPGSYEDFCSEYGYQAGAKRIYNAVCKEWKQVSDMWTADEIEKMQEIA
jgi:hypothetical protein